MPETRLRSSTEAKGPRASRSAMILAAVTSPMPSRVSSSAAVAVLTLTSPSPAAVPSRGRARGGGRIVGARYEHLLAVGEPLGQVHPGRARVAGHAAGGLYGIDDAASHGQVVDAGGGHLPIHMDAQRRSGSGTSERGRPVLRTFTAIGLNRPFRRGHLRHPFCFRPTGALLPIDGSPLRGDHRDNLARRGRRCQGEGRRSGHDAQHDDDADEDRLAHGGEVEAGTDAPGLILEGHGFSLERPAPTLPSANRTYVAPWPHFAPAAHRSGVPSSPALCASETLPKATPFAPDPLPQPRAVRSRAVPVSRFAHPPRLSRPSEAPARIGRRARGRAA